MASLVRSTVVILIAGLAGVIFGWIVVGPVVNVILQGEIEGPTTKPISGYGTLAGFLLGTVIVGGSRRFLKWAIAIGTSAGLTLGSTLEDHIGHLSLPWAMIGTLVGMTAGIGVGIMTETRFRNRVVEPL